MAVRDGASQEQLKQELYDIIDTYIIEVVNVYFSMSYMGDYTEFKDSKLKELIGKLKVEEYTYDHDEQTLYLTFDYKGNMDIILNDE